MIHIKLRETWNPRDTPADIYARNRGPWYLGAAAAHERYAVLASVPADAIVAVIELAGLDDAGNGRKALRGAVLGPGHPVHDALHGRPPFDSHRNPVTYVAHPLDHARLCACGCGSPVTGVRVFHVGHDQRAVHERIARGWGGSLAFVQWFDREFARSDQD